MKKPLKPDSYMFSGFLKVILAFVPYAGCIGSFFRSGFPVFSFTAMFFQIFVPVRPGRSGRARGAVKRTSYHCRQLGESWAFRRWARKILPFPADGVHSLVKISSFLGKNWPFSSCVLRKFLLLCIHTSRKLSDGNFTRSGIIWYDMPRISQCLTTPAAPDRRRGKRRRFYKKGPGSPEGRPDGRAQRENL